MPRKSKNMPTENLSKTAEINNAAVAGWRERIRDEMQRQGMSQRKLSQLSGLGPTSIRFALAESETITVETLRRISNALNIPYHYLAADVRTVVEEVDDNIFRRVKLLKVEPSDSFKDAVLPLHIAGLPENLHALKIADSAMRPDSGNYSVRNEHVLLAGDIAVWSPDAKPTVGSLVVAKPNGAHVVRMLVERDGGLQLVANNPAFCPATVDQSQLGGRVLLIQRQPG